MTTLMRRFAVLAVLFVAVSVIGRGTAAAAEASCVMLPSTIEYRDVLLMGPGGDFAGAMVVREKVVHPAVFEILQPGPGGDFAGATVTRVELTALEATDVLQMGPGGDFAGATVIQSPGRDDIAQLTCG